MSEGPSWVERRTVSGKRVQTPGRWLTGLEEEEKRADGQKEGRRRKKREGKKTLASPSGIFAVGIEPASLQDR